MSNNEDHDALVRDFCELTGASPQQGYGFLEANRWDISGAAAEYFTSQEEGGAEAQEPAEDVPQVPEGYTGPRTLDGRPAPTSAIPTVGSSSSSNSRPTRKAPRSGFATLDSLNQSGAGGHAGHGHDDDDDDDDEDYLDDEQPRDLFAGGEKSGLAVQDPRRNDPRSLVNDIIKKAQANSKKPNTIPETAPAAPSRFRGSGQTLGGDDTPSQVVPDPHAPAEPPTGAVQNRVLHLWNDGFSIEDGPLHRFDDPQNERDLQVIRSGRAPIHLMNVQTDQPVDVQLNKHDENYKAPPKVYKPFSGGGHRLGSPTPGSPAIAAPPATSTSSTELAASSPTTDIDINPDHPTVALRIQLANGTRLPARFNTTHTIGDVYGFIERAYPDSSVRPWVLATTFPNRDHIDKSAILGDMPEFKKGGTAVQKWT